MFVQKCNAIVKIFWIFGKGAELFDGCSTCDRDQQCDHARIENLAMFGEFVHYKSKSRCLPKQTSNKTRFDDAFLVLVTVNAEIKVGTHDGTSPCD